jgi:hypothetical protein
MSLITANDFLTGWNFLRDILSFLGRPVTRDEALGSLRRRLDSREADFCALTRAALYGSPRNPYLALLRNAGCEYGDLEALVGKEGLESALRRLFREGVYLTIHEFKGRTPVRRGALELWAGPSLLRNPGSGRHVLAHTGGSGGASVPVLIDLAFIRERAVDHLLALEARNGLDWIPAVWGIPGNTDMVRILDLCAMGSPPERWFSQVDPDSRSLHPRYRWSARVMRWAGRVRGTRVPAPEYVPLNDPTEIVYWLRHVLERGRTPHVITWASGAVRICQAAAQTGADLSGVQFSIGGEPITEAKLETVRRTGAAAVPRFMAMECGYIGYGCLKPALPDELHVVADMHAVIRTEDDGPARGLPQGALLLTSLRPSAPFVLLNVSLGDEAQVLAGSCGCRLEGLGWPLRIGRVRSFEKLTSGGMTFMDTDVVRVLEEVLPARFGGSLLDYQLVEGEDSAGKPRLSLVVSPSVGPLDAGEVSAVFLEAVGSGSGAERVMSLQWRDAGLLSVERTEPALAPSGKIVHVLKSRT